MKHFLVILAVIALTLTACGPEAEPTLDPASVQGTAMAAAMTMVAETQAAVPTATPLPPTEAPTATPIPTNTTVALSLETATLAPGVFPTNTSPPSSGNDPCNSALTSWEGDSAKITIRNNTKPKGTVTISLFFNTQMGQCGYLSAQFSNVATLTVPLGTFSAGAFVDGKKDFKVFGGGAINRVGNYTLWVENERIILKAGCAPNC